MQISVITNNPELAGVCEATLKYLSPLVVELKRLKATERPGDEACIWEFDPDVFPERLTSDDVRQSLFVMDRRHVGRFRERLMGLRASVVLKPVLGPNLLPFLQHSCGNPQVSPPSSTRREDEITRRPEDLLAILMSSQTGNPDADSPSDTANG